MAIKEPPGTAVAECYAESKTLAEVALELTGMAARVIFGNLEIDAGPLVIALNKLTTTHLISASKDVTFPICELGEVNFFKNADSIETKAAVAGCHAPSLTRSQSVKTEGRLADSIEQALRTKGSNELPVTDAVFLAIAVARAFAVAGANMSAVPEAFAVQSD